MKILFKIKSEFKKGLKENLSPNKIALALSIGISVSSTPLYGGHALIALMFAYIFKLNKPLCVAGTLFGNPFTVGFILVMELYLGYFVLTGKFIKLLYSQISLSKLGSLLYPLILGSAIFALLSFIGSYLLIRAAICFWNRKGKQKKKEETVYKINRLFWWKFLYKGCPVTPPVFREFMNVFFAVFFFFYLRASKRASSLNLQKITGQTGFIRRNLNVFKLFLKYSFCLTDGVNIMSNKINTKLKLTGREVYDHCKSLNKGMIFLTAHIGNWDTGSMLFSAEEDMKLNIIRKKEDDNEVQNFIHSLRYKSAKDKVNVIYVSDDAFSSIEIVNVLKKNEIVFIQGDRSYSGMKTIKIDFCGSEVEAPVGPYVIAWVSGAPIIPVFSLRIGFMKYEIRLTQPVYVDKSLGKEKAIDEVAKKVFGKIEEITKEFPHQWFCFYPYWDDKSKTEKKKVNTDKMKAVS